MVNFDELIDNYLKRKSYPKKIGRYWPSEAGGCIRKTWFSFNLPKEVDKSTSRIFEAGNRLHEFISDVIESDKNKHVKLLDKEIPIKIQEENFLIKGRIDDLLVVNINKEKYLVEVKSSKFLPRELREEHEMQLQLYMQALGVHKGILLYVQKDNLQTKQFFINYNKELVKKVLIRFEKLHKYLVENKIPEAEAKLVKRKTWLCGFCNYSEECEEAGLLAVKENGLKYQKKLLLD